MSQAHSAVRYVVTITRQETDRGLESMSDHKHHYEYDAAEVDVRCTSCGAGIPDIAEPWTPQDEGPEFHKDEESKLKQALFDLIQADARAEKWGRELSTLRERILQVVVVCEAAASQRGTPQTGQINPQKVIDILTGRKAKHVGSCAEHGHRAIDCPNLQENNPLSRPMP